MGENEGNGNDDGTPNGKAGSVVNLADARKRQRTLHRAGANGRADDPRASKGGKGGKGQHQGDVKGWRKLLLYGQFLLLLAIVAYMMQLCSHR